MRIRGLSFCKAHTDFHPQLILCIFILSGHDNVVKHKITVCLLDGFNKDNQIFNTIKYFLLVFFNKKVYHIGTDYFSYSANIKH